MIPAREQDGPDRYVEEFATFSRASVVAGVPGGRAVLLPDRGVGVLYRAHFRAGVPVRGEVSQVRASQAATHRGLATAGVDLDAHPAGNLDDLLCLGSADLLPGSATAARRDGNLCRGQAVDVEV